MSEQPEQPRKLKNEAIPDWAEGLYYNKGLFSEALVYHDEEAIYFEHRGRESAVVRFTFEMVEGLKMVEEQADSTEQEAESPHDIGGDQGER